MNQRLLTSFPPIAAPDAETLILGSMPGDASLAAGRYYAHPHNAFWPIMAGLLGFSADDAYADRVAALLDARIALWDVLGTCSRQGSLDARIDRASEVANDFAAFFGTHPHIVRVCFNGAKAETAFRRHVRLALDGRTLSFVRLPSTSPAHAALGFKAKLAAWRAAIPLPMLPAA